MKAISCGLCALLLSGCATFDKAFENRIAVTADCAEVHSLSKWGPVAIGSKVTAADAAVVSAAICNRALAKAVAQEAKP